MTAAEKVIWQYLMTDDTSYMGTLEVLERYCTWCGELEQQHANGKCLFLDTRFKPLGKRGARAFADKMIDSIKP